MIKKKIQKDNRTIFIIAPFIGIQILILFFIAVIFLGAIGHDYNPQNYVIRFEENDVSTNPPSCLDIKNSAAQQLYNQIIIRCCSLKDNCKEFKIKNYKDFVGFLASDLEYSNKTIISNLQGQFFYATPENDYLLTIPLEFEDGSETILKVKLHVRYVDTPYELYWLLIFSPTILLILILIIWRIRKKS